MAIDLIDIPSTLVLIVIVLFLFRAGSSFLLDMLTIPVRLRLTDDSVSVLDDEGHVAGREPCTVALEVREGVSRIVGFGSTRTSMESVNRPGFLGDSVT